MTIAHIATQRRKGVVIMTIDEAIELLELYEPHGPQEEWCQHREAVKLGIEALKQIKRYRKSSGIPCTGNLPGETEK